MCAPGVHADDERKGEDAGMFFDAARAGIFLEGRE